ncbi:MAG: DUF2961 domain-containing protein [Anaerolineales bacterium]|nr:MAG: DUF2961 domain-containing protein [Anaerolineales bacterium]
MNRRDFLKASGTLFLGQALRLNSGQALRPWDGCLGARGAAEAAREQETLLTAIESLANPVASLYLPLGTSVLFSSARRILDDDLPEDRRNFWDYTREDTFSDPHYGYFDKSGDFHQYKVKPGFDGTPEYVMAELLGPGVIPFMWFTHTAPFMMGPEHEKALEDAGVPPKEWGNIQAMGNIRIYVDYEPTPVLDMPMIAFLKRVPFSWRYRDNGANGTHYPFFFKKFIRIASTACPKYFVIKGVYLHPSVPVPSFKGLPQQGSPEQAMVDSVAAALGKPLEIPRIYGAQEFSQAYDIGADQPAVTNLDRPGIISGLRFAIPHDLPLDKRNNLDLSITYENGDSFTLPLAAFWGPLDRPPEDIYYQTALLGITTVGGEDVYYANFAMPFQRVQIRIQGRDAAAGRIGARISYFLADSSNVPPLRFRVYYSGPVRKEAGSDDFMLLPPGGKRKYVGGILSAREWIPTPGAWNCQYAEGNIKMIGPPPMPFTGWEDFFSGGYFPYSFMTPTRPLGGGTIYWSAYWNHLTVVGLFHGYNQPLVEAVSVEHGVTTDNEADLTCYGASFYYAL